MQASSVQRRAFLRQSAATALGVVGTALLAACGGSATAVTTGTTVPTSSARSVATSAAPTSSAASASTMTATRAATTASVSAASSAAAPAGQKVVLEHLDWWAPNKPDLKSYFDGIKADFERKYPNLTVNYVFVKGTLGVREKWITNAAGGTPHDSSQVSVAFIKDLMVQHLTEPLDAYTAKTKGMALSDFVDSGMFYNTYQGKHYGLPYDGPTTTVIGYNTDHFTEVGLDPSRNFTWHWTFNDFLAAAQKLTKTQGSQVVRGGFQPGGWSSFSSFAPWLYANGGQLYDSSYKHLLLNDKHGQDALQYILSLKNSYHLAASAKDASLDYEGYSMIIDGSYTAAYHLDSNPKLHWGYAPLPQGPGGQRPSTVTWTNQWSINGGSRHKDAAWEWVSFVNSEATLEKYFAGVLKRAAGRKAFYQSAAWNDVLKVYPQLKGLETIATVSGQWPWWDYSALTAATKSIWSDIGAGKADVTTALSQLKQVGDQVLAKG